jgi:hypothetical protein
MTRGAVNARRGRKGTFMILEAEKMNVPFSSLASWT